MALNNEDFNIPFNILLNPGQFLNQLKTFLQQMQTFADKPLELTAELEFVEKGRADEIRKILTQGRENAAGMAVEVARIIDLMEAMGGETRSVNDLLKDGVSTQVAKAEAIRDTLELLERERTLSRQEAFKRQLPVGGAGKVLGDELRAAQGKVRAAFDKTGIIGGVKAQADPADLSKQAALIDDLRKAQDDLATAKKRENAVDERTSNQRIQRIQAESD